MDVFALAQDAINKANDCIQLDNGITRPGISTHKNSKKKQDTPTNNGPETMDDIEKRYAERRRVEAIKDKDRNNEISRFQKDVDDISVTIDLNLRKILSIQTEDLAEQFGLVRENVDANSSRNMKALADRQMREQALLSLRNITSRFTSKKIFDELEGACTWLDAQHSNHVKTFEKLGIAVSEINGIRPADDLKDKELVALLAASDALLAESSEVNMAGSTTKINQLSSKFKEAQSTWKEESTAKIQAVEKVMYEKAGVLRQSVREIENELSEVRKRGGVLDKFLSETKEGQMREEINGQVKDIERRYEYHIERQRKQIVDLENLHEALKQEIEELQRSTQTNEIELNNLTQSKIPQASSNSMSANDSNFEIEEYLTQCQSGMRQLQTHIEISNKQLNDLKGLSDDCRDEVASLQNKSKKMKLEISSIMSRQKSKVRSLEKELQELNKEKTQIADENDQIHDRVMALTIAQNRRQQSTAINSSLNLDNEDGQNFLMKVKMANTDVSQITADRVLQKRKDNRFAPGHTRLWPDPNSSTKHDLIHFAEFDDKEEGNDDDDVDNCAGDDINYIPLSKSHVCEASYRHYAIKLLSKEGNTKSKKKGKGTSSVSPTCSLKEAISVCIAIVNDLLTLKHLDKSLLNSKIEELKSLNREIPIMKPEAAELAIYKDVIIPLLTHVTTYQVKNIVAENKMISFRVVLVNAFALLGVMFMCLPNIFSQFTFELTPHPGFMKHMEDISMRVLKKLLTSTTIKQPDEGRPTSRGANKDKDKKNKNGKPKIKEVEVDDPLHPRMIYQTTEAAMFQKFFDFKRLGLSNQMEVIREWMSEAHSRDGSKSMHKDWQGTSCNGRPCRGKTIYSEDRFGLCAYQILIYELSAFGLQNSHDVKYKKMSLSSLNNLKDCLNNIKRQSSSYTTEFSNIEVLLKRVTPCSVPIIMALEFARKIIDEELARQSIFDDIANGTHEDLQYLKSSRVTSASGSRAGTAAREDAFLKSLPPDERQYLLDMQMTINLAVDDVLEAFDVGVEGDDDYDTVKVNDFLKKHITKHMYILDSLVFGPFDNAALPKVKTEIYKFQKYIKDLTQARNKTLDIGGEYSKPLRAKLIKLNNELATQLEIFYQKCHGNKLHEAEIIEMHQETIDLYDGNRSVIKGSFSHYPDNLERIIMLVTKDTESLHNRRATRQALKNDCKALKSELLALRGHHDEMKNKIFEIGNALSYTTAQATMQGAHLILTLLMEMIQFFEDKREESNGTERANVAELIAIQRQKAQVNGSGVVDTEKILRHILSYFGEEDFAVLGAVFLDDSITRSMSQGLEVVVAEQRARPLLRKESTRIDEFHISNEKESKFRNGSGVDPRHVNNKRGHRMSVVQMDSFVNEAALPAAVLASDIISKSRESSGHSSRRPSVAGFNDANGSRPSSQSRRPTSHELHSSGGIRKPSSAGGRSVLPMSRESNERADEISSRLFEQFLTPSERGPSSSHLHKDFEPIVAPGEKLQAFNDSECTSKFSPSVSTITTKTKGGATTSKSIDDLNKKVVPLVNMPKSGETRKATLALLSGGDGKVTSYVAK